ncbi:MAG: BatA domain-containing protein, partial [Pirellulales bacterium]
MDNHIYLLAFGFTNLAMLGWLAAAAAPLLIHLWSRHRFREAPWAAMQFLLAAMRKNARRMQLQQWLLLAVRTLIIVLVVLAVAEPYGEPLLAGGSSTPTHHVLVIDGSYSMAYRDEGPSRFERARQLAAAMVRLGRPADTFTVILMSKPARSILDRDVIDHAAVAAQIEALTQPHSGADLAGALTLVQEALSAKSEN